MKKTLLPVILVLLTTSIRSQTADFDLSDYKLPVLKRKLLETNFNLAGSDQSSKLPSPYNFDRSANQYSGNFNLIYNSYLNTPSQQKVTNGQFYLSGSYQSEKEDDYNESNRVFYPVFNLQSENRWYKGKKFLELGYDLRYSSYFSKTSSDVTTKSKYSSTLVGVPIKAGFGRIEQIQDARHAIYILDELALQERLSSGKSREEIIAIAEHISKLKNKRFFDHRHRRIYEIESVDSFLRSNINSLNTDARYFSTLTDIWEYGAYPLRYSGTRLSAVLQPSYAFLTNENSNDVNSSETDQQFFLGNFGVEIVHEKPLNLYWQNSVDFSFYYILMMGDIDYISENIKSKVNYPIIQLSFNQQFGFYPNTRTSLLFKYGISYVNLLDRADTENRVAGGKNEIIQSNAGLSFNYYISPRFRLNGSVTANYFMQINDNVPPINPWWNLSNSNFEMSYYKRNFSSNFNIGFSYSIF
jgi:hypothetical protein